MISVREMTCKSTNIIEKRVSCISPCYNGEKYIDGYFRSIFEQNYENLQLIIMDDGSTDNSKEMILKYKDLAADRGISLEYHYHDNVGVAATVEEALQYINGEYLIWPDIDDFMAPDSIRKKVEFLDNHLEYDIVRTECRIVDESDTQTTIKLVAREFGTRYEEDLFEKCLLNNGFYYQPGCYMVRVKKLWEVIPNGHIYHSRYGQNFQLLLPFLYNAKCGYIDEPLFTYVIRQGSIAHTIKPSYEKLLDKINVFEKTVIDTLANMVMEKEERMKYTRMVEREYVQKKINLAFEHRNAESMEYYYGLYKKMNYRNNKVEIEKRFFSSKLLRIIIKVRRSWKKKY